MALTLVAAPASATDWLCWQGEHVRSAASPARVEVVDRFTAGDVALARPTSLCSAAAPGVVPSGPPTHAAAWTIRRRPDAATTASSVTVTNHLATTTLRVGGVRSLLATDAGWMTCRDVEAPRRTGRRPRLVIGDAGGLRTLLLGRPRRLCMPPIDDDRPELLCHAVTPLAAADRATPPRGPVDTVLGRVEGRAGSPSELCVESTRTQLPSPPAPGPPEPPPGVLRVGAVSRPLITGDKVRLRAFVDRPNGTSANWSDRVEFRSSDERIAVVRGDVLETVGRGTVEVSAFDEATGLTSAGAGNAEVTVTWPLVRMQIQPRWIALSMGDSGRFVVWGIMESGQWRDLTAQVTLTSSNPHAAVLEDVPVPGTVRAVGLGIATVVATDPISGLRSTDFDQAAAIYVTDGLARIDIRGGSDRGYFPARRVGESFRFTAIGVMADGSEQNFTQRCAWWSSDPAIAIAANQEGDRSRIDAVQLGTVRIGCRDPESQLPSNERDFDVIGALASIAIDVDSYNRPVRSGKPGWATAIGIYHPFADSDDHGRRNITQEVTWTSRDPGVAAMDNPEGARSRIDFVASGIARVYATDPVTGIVSYDGFVRSVGNPIALTFDRPGRAQVPIGGLNYYEVRGIYDGGVTYNLTRFAPEEYVLEAEDSSVAGAFLGGGGVSYIVGLKAGVTEIRARHLATGVVSAPQTLTVLGDLVAVALEPRNVLLGAGETHSLTGFGVYAPGVRFLATQELVYTSSNPAVVVATNEPGNRSRLLAVGPGTAVISATDPATGITSTTSGDDVTVEVLMGPPDRITIAPTDVVLAPNLSLQLTARAHWPDGRTTNVTQQVLWTSTAPAVVETPNVDRARSRLDAHLPGAARISALHPSGVRSTTSGSDVTVRVLATTTRALAPSVAYVRVGDTFRFTLIATLTDGSSLNLTQHAGYGTSNWNIAEAPNVGGDRSAYTCMSAGTVDVTATSDDLPGFIGPFYPVRATLICVP